MNRPVELTPSTGGATLRPRDLGAPISTDVHDDPAYIDLLAALSATGLEHVDHFTLTDVSGAKPEHAGARRVVLVLPFERGVVLVERRRELRWMFPDGDLEVALRPGVPLRVWIGRAHASASITQRVQALHEGPVRIATPSFTRWRPIRDGLALRLDHPRLLLLLHGALSSTVGTFAPFGCGPIRGRLGAWLRICDAVVGVDLPTLTETPREGAARVLEMLRRWGWRGRARLDIVGVERGGLVARWLVEQMLPEAGLPLRVGNVVTIGTPHGGLPIAAPERRHELLNRLTTLRVAAVRRGLATGLSAPVLGAALRDDLRRISLLAHALRDGAERSLPGLDALAPNAPEIAALRQQRDPVLSPQTRYYGVFVNHEPRDAPEELDSGLPPTATRWAEPRSDLWVPLTSSSTLHPALEERRQLIGVWEAADVFHHTLLTEDRTADVIGALLEDITQAGAIRGTAGTDELGWGGPEEPPVALFVEARGPTVAELERRVLVEVTVQRDPFPSQLGPGIDRAQGLADADTPLVVECLPRGGLVIADGTMTHRLDVPGDEPVTVRFVLEAVELLDVSAEVHVNVRQGAEPLAQLRLEVEVVEPGQTASTSRLRHDAAVPARRGTPPDVQLWVSCFRAAHGTTLRYTLLAPALGTSPQYPDVVLPPDHRQRVEALFREIEQAWQSSTDRAVFDARLSGLGADLAALLLPDQLRTDLWTLREALSGLSLLTDEPYLPWEMVWIAPDRGPAGLFLGELGLTRAMRGAFCPDQLCIRNGHRFTVVPRYPAALALLHALDEEAWLTEHLGTAPIDTGPPRPAAPLRRHLARQQHTDLLHFAGHGDADASEVYLVMGGREHGGRWTPELLPSRAAHPLDLSTHRGGALVFLNACKAGRHVSALAGERSWARTFLVEGGAAAFVAPLWSVGDARASTFARALYGTLAEGSTFAVAARDARRAARTAGDPSWLSYAVYARPHTRVRFS